MKDENHGVEHIGENECVAPERFTDAGKCGEQQAEQADGQEKFDAENRERRERT